MLIHGHDLTMKDSDHDDFFQEWKTLLVVKNWRVLESYLAI